MEMEDVQFGLVVFDWLGSVGAPANRMSVGGEVKGEVEPNHSLSSPFCVMESVSLYVTFSSGLSFAQR